ADEQVAGRAVAEGARPRDRGGERTTNRGAFGERDVECELLAAPGQPVGQRIHGHPGLRAHHEIAGRVLDDLVQAAQVEQHVQPPAGTTARSPAGQARSTAATSSTVSGSATQRGDTPHTASSGPASLIVTPVAASASDDIRTVPPFRTPPADARPCARPAPRRTAAAWGTPCRGSTGRGGRRRTVRAAWCRGRRRRTCAACTWPCRRRRRARR